MRSLLTSVGFWLAIVLVTGSASSAPPGSRGGHGGGGHPGGHSGVYIGGYSGGYSGGHHHHSHNSTADILFGVGAVLGGVGAISNGPPPYYGERYYAAPQPVYAQPEPVYEPSDEEAVVTPSNPPPTPPKKTSIKIVNPKTNTATLSYTLDGEVYQIKPGEVQELEYEYEIAFDRGNGGAAGRYSLTKGVYTFTPTAEGAWELYNSDN